MSSSAPPGNTSSWLKKSSKMLPVVSVVNAELREGKARVRTIIRSGDSEAEVAYLLVQRADVAWRAYDIVIYEVSMARNYRKEFYRLVKEKGFDGLVDRIEERTREKEKEL